MKKLRLGQKVRMLVDNSDYYSEGDVGTIVGGSIFHNRKAAVDRQGDYWANFHGNGNPHVCDYNHICIGKPGVAFELVREEVDQ